MKKHSCFIMGLPEAGKTTYLAALWYSLEQSSGTVLKLKQYTGNHQYLVRLAETWLLADKVSRTSILSEEKSLSLLLEDHEGREFQVAFPDLSGESFQKQYVDREIDKEIATYISESDGILLFINPEKIQEPCLISQIPLVLRHSTEEGEQVKTHDPIQDDPTEVQLVALLQFVDYLRDSMKVRLGIVVSAWDVISEQDYRRPEKFVKERLPLLWQYISSNSTLFDVFYYGISAQGGRLDNEDDSLKLLQIDDQIQRIMVVDNNEKKFNDITLPLWEVLD